MTGPEHYRTAQEMLEQARFETTGGDEENYHLAAAQVHATLALAAATALRTTDLAAWSEAAGPPPPDPWSYDRPDPEDEGPDQVNGFAIGRQP